MKVILLTKILGLGNADDIKEVADGYAINYLFPKHLAVLASQKAINDLEAIKQKKVKQSEEDLLKQQSLATRLDGLSLTLKEKTNDSNLFYAAINAQKIFDALKKSGIAVQKNNIITKPIKEPGEYDVVIKLSHGLEAKIHLLAEKLD